MKSQLRQFAGSAITGLLIALLPTISASGGPTPVTGEARVSIHSVHDGNWTDPQTWAEHRVPTAGDVVQIRAGMTVEYNASSDAVIRTIHIAGTLRFARDRSTKLTVGLIKIQFGETFSEDGFNCDDRPDAEDPGTGPRPALEIGTLDQPIPADVTATVRLAYVDDMNRETCPAIIDCGGRWDVHGSPMSRTWVKLGADSAVDSSTVTLSEPVTGWRIGDHVFVTSSNLGDEVIRSFASERNAKKVHTEEATVTAIDGVTITLNRPLRFAHSGTGPMRSEIANLSRNVVIESADPTGVRGHTMYHANSSGGISYAEFRHLGKQGILGKYAIHFHLCRGTMRGSAVVGASIWDSANRWVTIHGTDHLLVRDCVGFGSVGHGFFLEDGTEAYNILDRNLAVHAYKGKPLPKQALNFDSNDGAGFWWAAGRNTFVRNVSCENDQYGYHFEQSEGRHEDFRRPLEMPDGTTGQADIRTVPFYRFENNESHCDGLYSFNFGADRNGAVTGDKAHPFICRNLRSWETHYSMRPMVRFFLVDGLSMINSVYGVYHPDYDAHVYRNIYLNHVISEPINRGHDDEDNQYGDFTYENLTLENCSGNLIQLTSTAPKPGVVGHFRNVIVKDSNPPSRERATVDLGTGTMNDKLENPVVYYFHDLFKPGEAIEIVSNRFPELYASDRYHAIPNFTGPRVKAIEVTGVKFPNLLDPVDDLPPATIITSVRDAGEKIVVEGVTTDNSDVGVVTVNGTEAKPTATAPGILDWSATIDPPAEGRIAALARDKAGNIEKIGHVLQWK